MATDVDIAAVCRSNTQLYLAARVEKSFPGNDNVTQAKPGAAATDDIREIKSQPSRDDNN